MEKNWEGGESRGRSRVEWGKGDGGEQGREGGRSQGPEPGPARVHPYTQQEYANYCSDAVTSKGLAHGARQ